MNKIIIVALVTISFFALVSCETSPILELNLSKLKSLMASDTISGFSIYNRGDENLVIENIRVSCICTVLNINKGTVIKPNDSLYVPILLEKYDANQSEIYVTMKTNADPLLTSFGFNRISNNRSL